jgi:hypothetical protein
LGDRRRTRAAIRNAIGGSRLRMSSVQAAFMARELPRVRYRTTIAESR